MDQDRKNGAPPAGLGRRDFLKFCGQVAALLGLEASAVPSIAHALTSGQRPPVVWLQLSECTGCSESFLRSVTPSVEDVLLKTISDDYHEVLMAPSGAGALKSLGDTLKTYPGQFFAVIEGAIPTANGGLYGTVGGRTMIDVAREVCAKAKAVVAIGTCGSYGGVAAAAPNPTGAKGVYDALGVPVVNVPGCPPNPVVFTALIVNYLLKGTLPPLDALRRPTFAYGQTIHENCPRHLTNTAGPCLKPKGCKGPTTRNTCPTQRFNEATSFCIAVDHPCIGCSEPGFWDKAPFYRY